MFNPWMWYSSVLLEPWKLGPARKCRKYLVRKGTELTFQVREPLSGLGKQKKKLIKLRVSGGGEIFFIRAKLG